IRIASQKGQKLRMERLRRATHLRHGRGNGSLSGADTRRLVAVAPAPLGSAFVAIAAEKIRLLLLEALLHQHLQPELHQFTRDVDVALDATAKQLPDVFPDARTRRYPSHRPGSPFDRPRSRRKNDSGRSTFT